MYIGYVMKKEGIIDINGFCSYVVYITNVIGSHF